MRRKTENCFEVRPALSDEADLFYSLPEEKDKELGCIGHVRIDFGYHGKNFWTTWFPRGEERLNSPEFRAELDALVKELQTTGPLKNLDTMVDYCLHHGGHIDGGWTQCYGYVVETDRYRFCLRCIPAHGDYNAYLTAFDLREQEMSMRERPVQGQQMGGM